MSAERFFPGQRVVLGSRSPRRAELLGSYLTPRQLVIQPPASPDEPGFEGLSADEDIRRRLLDIVRLKHDSVCQQVSQQPERSTALPPLIVVADTTVVAGPFSGSRHVLGQPRPDFWRDDVCEWFQRWLSGRTHEVWTAVRVSCGRAVREQIVSAAVTFSKVSPEQLEWYLSTCESTGKAGGYAVQGLASAFVTRVEGSLTAIIGLPLLETLQLLTAVREEAQQSHHTVHPE
ncbi:MAG: Maf family protein [Planctomycetota bacterium]